MRHSKSGRRRRSSSIIYQEPPESIEHCSDQSALPNLNANWVNAKGGSIISLLDMVIKQVKEHGKKLTVFDLFLL